MHLRRRELLQRGEKELVHPRAQIGEGRSVGVAGGPEDPMEGLGRGGGTDRKAKAGNTVGAKLLEGSVGVGFGVTRFIAVIVVGNAVGEDE
jgi:hypothetical protein